MVSHNTLEIPLMTLETSSTEHASQRRMILAIVAFAALAPAGLMAASAIAGQLIEAQGDDVPVHA